MEQDLDRELRSGRWRKGGGGAHRRDTAANAGMRRGEQRRAAEAGEKGVRGRCPGGRRFAPGEEVGSGCTRWELRLKTLLTGGGW